MTYLVLARKWRPRSFDTLIGQDHVVRALTHALSTQRLHHAWLFTGTRGVGKTTLSRILAKSLNCETGITAAPCGVCQACTEIDAGRFVDYIELDAASNRGVDEMTQLLEQAVYAPSGGRFKVYMIDEVHMLTGHAFNAMLKTLEEPPPHVKFILATTDPQKIPVTVLSRCLQFNLKQMTADAIVGHLQAVLDQESIQYEIPALRLIAQAASGSMRDALSLTDQAIAYSAGNLAGEAVQGMLGTIDQRHLVRLIQALASGNAAAVIGVADELAARGLSYAGALADLAILLSRVAIQQRVPGAMPDDDPVAADIVQLADMLHPDQVQLFYSVAVHSRQELSLAPDEYAGFVMACLRMLALVPEGTVPPQNASGGSGRVSATPISDAAQASAADAASAATSTAVASARPSASVAPTAAPAQPSDLARADGIGRAASIAASSTVAPPPPPVAPAPPVSAASPQSGADVPAWEELPADSALAEAAVPAADPSTEAKAAVRPDRPQAGVAPATKALAGGRGDFHSTSKTPAYDAAAGSPPADTAQPGSNRGRPATAGSAPEAGGQGNTPPTGPKAAKPSADQAAVPDDEGFSAAGPDDGYFDDARFEPAGYDDAQGPDEAGFESMADDFEPLTGSAQPGSALDGAQENIAAAFAPARKKSKSPRVRDMTPQAWPALAATLPLTGLAAELARQSEWLGSQGDQVNLRVAIRTLAESPGKARLCTVLSEYFGTVVQLNIEYGATGEDTAHAVQQAQRKARQQQAERAVESDAFVRTLIDEFGAHVVAGSISAAPQGRAAEGRAAA